MIEVIEYFLCAFCWSIGLMIYLYILPKMRDHHGWHVMGLNVFGAYAGYLGFEIVADSRWLDDRYAVYLAGNSMFPIAAGLVIYGYWRSAHRG